MAIKQALFFRLFFVTFRDFLWLSNFLKKIKKGLHLMNLCGRHIAVEGKILFCRMAERSVIYKITGLYLADIPFLSDRAKRGYP